MTTRGKYIQSMGGKNPSNDPGKAASGGKHLRNSHIDSGDEDTDEDEKPTSKVIVRQPTGVQRGRRGPVGKNIYNQRVERDRSCSESDGPEYDEPPSPVSSQPGITTRGKGKKGKTVQSKNNNSADSSPSSTYLAVNGSHNCNGQGGGGYAFRGKGGKSIGKRITGKQNPSVSRHVPPSTTTGKSTPLTGKRNPPVASKDKRYAMVGKKIPQPSRGKKNPSVGKGNRVPSVGKRIASKGKKNVTSNEGSAAIVANGDKEQTVQSRKSRGKNIENLQPQPLLPEIPLNCAVNDDASNTNSNPTVSGTGNFAHYISGNFCIPNFNAIHHHEEEPQIMPPPAIPPPVSQSNNNSQRITRGKNILNQQQQSMQDNCSNSKSSTTSIPCSAPYFIPPSSTSNSMTVINFSSTTNDHFSATNHAWQNLPQGNPYFYPHSQHLEQQQQQQQYYLRRRSTSSNIQINTGANNFDPSKGDGGPPKVRSISQQQQFYNSHPADVPLFVDCSVEYELPGVPRPSTSNDHPGDQLLIVQPGWQQKRRITRSTSQQRLLEQQQWFRQHHQMQQEYQLQLQQQRQQLHQTTFSLPAPQPAASRTTAPSATATSSTAVSNANSSRPQYPFGGGSDAYRNPNMFSCQAGRGPGPASLQHLRAPFYPSFPPQCCPQCPPASSNHHSMMGPFIQTGGSNHNLPPPPYNNNMVTAPKPAASSSSSSSNISPSSSSASSTSTSATGSRKRSYTEATIAGSIHQQHQQHQLRLQYQQHQQLQQTHHQQQQQHIKSNLTIGRA